MAWPDGGAEAVLTQQGSEVTGTYRLYGGRLQGTARGDRLEGTWTEGTRQGRFVFVLGPERRGFTGRSEDGAWWTGTRRTRPALVAELRRDTPQATLLSFLRTGNAASADHPDLMADAARLLAFGPDATDPRQRIARTRALYRVLALTTIADPLPPQPDGDAVVLTLGQSGSEAHVAVTLRRAAEGWEIVVPPPLVLAAAERAMLQRDGGRARGPGATEALRSPRDTLRSFIAGIQSWDQGGVDRVLATLDLGEVRTTDREDVGRLQALYLIQALNRIGPWDWQMVPDDPAIGETFVFFSHRVGRIAIAPSLEGERTVFRFTPDTVAAALRLFIATESMPRGIGPGVPTPPTGVFLVRERLAAVSPVLLERSLLTGLENWQVIAIVAMFGSLVLATLWVVPLAMRALAWLAVRLSREPDAAAVCARLVWPLRLIVIAAIWFNFRRLIAIVGPGLTVLDATMGIVVAVGLAWAGLPLIDSAARWFQGRARRTPGSMDDILVSLTAGVAKLGLVLLVALIAAKALDLPLGAMLAGLGIGGLAVAFASKEALSNLFGAGILLADRPFTNGDTIAIGDIQGTVEHVGIRSTRIRTMDDTVVVLPNGKLSDALINNYGARRYRLFRTKFSVAYGAHPERLEAFTRRLREVVDVHKSTVEERTQVGVWQLGEGGVEIDLVCYFRAETAAEERAARHELLLQVMRLAEETGVTFAAAPVATAPPGVAGAAPAPSAA